MLSNYNCKLGVFIFSQLDAQLADMDSHREKAVAAVAKGNSVLQDAANTLRTLKGKGPAINAGYGDSLTPYPSLLH